MKTIKAIWYNNKSYYQNIQVINKKKSHTRYVCVEKIKMYQNKSIKICKNEIQTLRRPQKFLIGETI